MAEHKTQSPMRGQGTSQGRDQEQRADGKGEMGGFHDRKDAKEEGRYRGKGQGRHDD